MNKKEIISCAVCGYEFSDFEITQNKHIYNNRLEIITCSNCFNISKERFLQLNAKRNQIQSKGKVIYVKNWGK